MKTAQKAKVRIIAVC